MSLVKDCEDSFLAKKEIYEDLIEKYPQFQKGIERNEYHPYSIYTVRKSYYELSKFGKIFLEACIKK